MKSSAYIVFFWIGILIFFIGIWAPFSGYQELGHALALAGVWFVIADLIGQAIVAHREGGKK